jgi:hypothetical protein
MFEREPNPKMKNPFFVDLKIVEIAFDHCTKYEFTCFLI